MKPYASGTGPKGCGARIARLSRGSVADDRQTILIANASNAMAAKHASMISRAPCLKAITTRCTWEQCARRKTCVLWHIVRFLGSVLPACYGLSVAGGGVAPGRVSCLPSPASRPSRLARCLRPVTTGCRRRCPLPRHTIPRCGRACPPATLEACGQTRRWDRLQWLRGVPHPLRFRCEAEMPIHWRRCRGHLGGPASWDAWGSIPPWSVCRRRHDTASGSAPQVACGSVALPWPCLTRTGEER